MKIRSLHLYSYRLKLVRPFFIGGKKMTYREGLIIHLISDQGVDGFGEIAPLEARGREKLKDVLLQAQRLKSQLVGQFIPPGVEHLDGKMELWLEEFDLWPSVRFGVEMAVLGLISNSRNTPFFRFIEEGGHDHIRVHGLLDGSRQEVLEQAKKLKDEGFTQMKLKVSGSIEESADMVKAVNNVLQGQAVIHLDANQAWELDEAIRFGREIECSAVTYIEEPLKHVYDTSEFYRETLIPVALDESLLTMSFDDFRSMEGVDVIVLKPMMLGGIEKTWHMMQQAAAVGLSAVVSSSFESGLGILTLANLAGCLSRDYGAGLGTLEWMREDLLRERPSIYHGKMDISQRLTRKEDINFSLLTPII